MLYLQSMGIIPQLSENSIEFITSAIVKIIFLLCAVVVVLYNIKKSKE